MALPCYLAMTAAEFAAAEELPQQVAWMACHFSCYGTGLSNLPAELPEGSMVILNDRTPICGHDPDRITKQLEELLLQFRCSGLLLDLQRPDNPETASLCKTVLERLDCPVGITEFYARELPCPIFVAPPPLRTSLEKYLNPWQGREIWLEAATDGEIVTVTEQGSTCSPAPLDTLPEPWFRQEQLHCRYYWTADQKAARFAIQRQAEDLSSLLAEAEGLGVTRAVGLYQQLWEIP